jgi:hypothetical protein
MQKLISTLLMAPVATLGSLVLLAPTTRADAGQYLADLHSSGTAYPQIPNSGLIAIGNDVCVSLRGGMTSDAARDKLVTSLWHGGYHASDAEARTVVRFAQQDLCGTGTHGPGPYGPGPAPNAPLGPFAPGN